MKIVYNKKIIYLAIFIILIVVISIILLLSNKNIKQDSEIISDANNIIESNNITQCSQVNKNIDGVNYKTVCENNIYFNQAISNLDISFCSKLDDKLFLINDCINQVIEAKIQQDQNILICDNLEISAKQTCQNIFWQKEASNNIDISKCSNITDEKMKESCRRDILPNILSTNKNFACNSLDDVTKQSDCELFKLNKCANISDGYLQMACQRGSQDDN